MSAVVEIRLSENLQRLLQRGIGPAALRGIARAHDRENEYTIGATVKNRMSFPRPPSPTTLEGLRVVSGHLRRSLRRSNAVISGAMVVSAIGSNVKYFGVHEFGATGEASVKAHERRRPDVVRLGDNTTANFRLAARLGMLTKSGKARKGVKVESGGMFQVKAHSRRLNFPARRMLRRTVEERADNYARAMEREVVKEMNGGQS